MDKKEYQKQYRLNHREEIAKYQKQYREAHHEEIAQYYQNHKEEIIEHNKQYYQDHKEETSKYKSQFYQEHKKEKSEYNKEYRSTPYGRAIVISNCNNFNDKTVRGFDTSNNVDAQWIVDNVFSGQCCIYCGESDWRLLGVDRIDNSLPHISSNLVPCCSRCNNLRGNRRTVEEMIEYMKNNK